MPSVEKRIQELFGGPLTGPVGILHVAAVWKRGDGGLRTLRIGPDSPRSDSDRFSLDLARARCDAIVTTGRILREEPGVTHALPEALGDWRRERRGLASLPVSVVLTGRADLDLAHPLLVQAGRAIVVTSPEVAAALEARVSGEQIEVVARSAVSLRDTLDFLQRERGLESVCIEAGPSSSQSLYKAPLRVDELMLSVFLGERIAEGVEGGVFAERDALDELFAKAHDCGRREASGPWSFERHLAR